MALIYVPWDFFVKPVAEDHEVWFGFTFTGVWAKWLAIPHEIVYAGALYGFLRAFVWGVRNPLPAAAPQPPTRGHLADERGCHRSSSRAVGGQRQI